MKLPDNLLLTADDIRYLRPTQLSTLTRIQSESFSAWSVTRRMSEASLTAIANALGINREEVLRGFDLRRQDYALAKAAKEKADRLISVSARTSPQNNSGSALARPNPGSSYSRSPTWIKNPLTVLGTT